MGKLTIEQAKKMMEAAKNAETNPVDDKFYPESKITTADKIDTGEPKNLPSKKKMPGVIKKIRQMLPAEGPSNPSNIFQKKDKKYKYVGTSSIKKLKSGSKKKMPKARDMAMGDKNITYLGDPFMVDGKMFDPVKAHPEDYLRPEGAKTYSEGGEINVGKGGDYIKDLID